MVVISTETYEQIRKCILDFPGLAIQCEGNLKQQFPNLDPHVVRAILSKEWQKHMRNHHHHILRISTKLLKEYKAKVLKHPDPFLLLQIAVRERCTPVGLCRILLNIEYGDQPKSIIAEMIKSPHTIPEPLLSANVLNCLYNDSCDGPITDMVRRTIGEDYEERLKKLASDAGLEFHDEVYLRRYGYDKTPDLKLAIPCMYKGKVINWIESKASFGDMESHKRHIIDQLSSYGNRFGSGIIIYWLGYLETIAKCPENKDFIFVTDDFPKKGELALINLPFK